MLAIFWDESGVLYMEFLTKGLTVNSDRGTVQPYDPSCNTSAESNRKDRLHHGNARQHYIAQKQDVMGKLKFTVVPQPPFSHDLTPSDFWCSQN
ncbi:hypothetical protein TNCV_1562441 [Trichonephila clavipes]|nr:hypothetical protein TNCV_1562441 [Trichonephila clavipes]